MIKHANNYPILLRFILLTQYFTAIIIIQVYYIDGEVIVGISKKLCMWSVENIL